MPKITKVGREGNSISIEVEGIPNHSFVYNMEEFNTKEQLIETLNYAVSAHKKLDCTALYDDIKKLEGSEISA